MKNEKRLERKGADVKERERRGEERRGEERVNSTHSLSLLDSNDQM
jgi:hypothetical protein